MTGEAVRWRKYGKDRLYVTAADGTKLGHRDLPEQSPEPGTEMPKTGAPEVEDLAQRRAGAMAREQARALKQAAPVRTFVARVLGVHTDERAWRIGADGEEMVAAQLAKLARKDPRWHFLHAIPVGENGADIDHLVVGPGGVYSLNAKHHPGAKVWVGGNTLMINGQRQPYIRNSRFEAQRASKLLTAGCGFAVVVTGWSCPSAPTTCASRRRQRTYTWSTGDSWCPGCGHARSCSAMSRWSTSLRWPGGPRHGRSSADTSRTTMSVRGKLTMWGMTRHTSSR